MSFRTALLALALSACAPTGDLVVDGAATPDAEAASFEDVQAILISGDRGWDAVDAGRWCTELGDWYRDLRAQTARCAAAADDDARDDDVVDATCEEACADRANAAHRECLQSGRDARRCAAYADDLEADCLDQRCADDAPTRVPVDLGDVPEDVDTVCDGLRAVLNRVAHVWEADCGTGDDTPTREPADDADTRPQR